MGFLKDFVESEKSSLPLATVATPATLRSEVATVATVAVAKPQNRLADSVSSPREAELTKAPAFDPVRLQREADRLNAEAARNHSTDRFCRCGHLATFAWPGDDGGAVWICDECAPTRGRA